LSDKKEILSKYLPEKSVDLVIDLLDRYPCYLKIVNKRKTKHGDFKKLPNGAYQITINNDLNEYRFLLTLIHEIAHLVTFKRFKRVKPHGAEWKRNFQQLMLPFVNPEIYSDEILPFLAGYLINPKASTDADLKLSLILKQYDKQTNKSFIFEIPFESKFQHNNKIFVKGNKRRTRYECVEVQTDRKYMFHANAEVDLLKN